MLSRGHTDESVAFRCGYLITGDCTVLKTQRSPTASLPVHDQDNFRVIADETNTFKYKLYAFKF
jgi:hypothetical protein